jgi:hypothetical protein
MVVIFASSNLGDDLKKAVLGLKGHFSGDVEFGCAEIDYDLQFSSECIIGTDPGTTTISSTGFANIYSIHYSFSACT